MTFQLVFLGNGTTHCLFLQQVVSSFCAIYSRPKKPEIKERQFVSLITQSSVHNYIVGPFRSGRASTAVIHRVSIFRGAKKKLSLLCLNFLPYSYLNIKCLYLRTHHLMQLKQIVASINLCER
uniref:Uncharacterized protein n=1 Tax=Trichogramma kaykai TaxID=54128 RepID=A0ABD2VYU3_9HYME